MVLVSPSCKSVVLYTVRIDGEGVVLSRTEVVMTDTVVSLADVMVLGEVTELSVTVLRAEVDVDETASDVREVAEQVAKRVRVGLRFVS